MSDDDELQIADPVIGDKVEPMLYLADMWLPIDDGIISRERTNPEATGSVSRKRKRITLDSRTRSDSLKNVFKESSSSRAMHDWRSGATDNEDKGEGSSKLPTCM
jgi:hypothetical protein